jgi:hypothetical protein
MDGEIILWSPQTMSSIFSLNVPLSLSLSHTLSLTGEAMSLTCSRTDPLFLSLTQSIFALLSFIYSFYLNLTQEHTSAVTSLCFDSAGFLLLFFLVSKEQNSLPSSATSFEVISFSGNLFSGSFDGTVKKWKFPSLPISSSTPLISSADTLTGHSAEVIHASVHVFLCSLSRLSSSLPVLPSFLLLIFSYKFISEERFVCLMNLSFLRLSFFRFRL